MAEIRKLRGRIQLRLDADERRALSMIVGHLQPALAQGLRTTPRAYDEMSLQGEYDRWVRPEIERGIEADLSIVRDCLDAGEDVAPLTEAQAFSWVRAMNHLRLAASDVLGIEEEGWGDRDVSAKLGARPEYRMLMVLTYLQEELVAALE